MVVGVSIFTCLIRCKEPGRFLDTMVFLILLPLLLLNLNKNERLNLMSDQKPTILDNILFFALITIFVVCTVSLIKSGVIGVFSLLGSCK